MNLTISHTSSNMYYTCFLSYILCICICVTGSSRAPAQTPTQDWGHLSSWSLQCLPWKLYFTGAAATNGRSEVLVLVSFRQIRLLLPSLAVEIPIGSIGILQQKNCNESESDSSRILHESSPIKIVHNFDWLVGAFKLFFQFFYPQNLGKKWCPILTSLKYFSKWVVKPPSTTTFRTANRRCASWPRIGDHSSTHLRAP